MRTLILTFLLLLGALVAAGCGSGGGDTGEPNGPQVGAERSSMSEQSAETVSAADVDRVLEAEDSINTRCRLATNQEGSDIPVSEAIQILADVYRISPDGVFAAGVSTQPRNMEVIIRDNAAKLRDCGAGAEAERLERVVEAA